MSGKFLRNYFLSHNIVPWLLWMVQCHAYINLVHINVKQKPRDGLAYIIVLSYMIIMNTRTCYVHNTFKKTLQMKKSRTYWVTVTKCNVQTCFYKRIIRLKVKRGKKPWRKITIVP